MSLKDRASNIAIGYAAMILWLMIITGLFKGVYNLPSLSFQMLFWSLVFAPLTEELIFRKAVLDIAKDLRPSFMLPIVILSSAIFGWLHGAYVNVAIQGVLGAIMAWVYIKNGYHYWSSCILHAMYNGSIILLYNFKP